MSSNYSSAMNRQNRIKIVYISLVFVGNGNVNNCKPARPPLGDHGEVLTIEEIAHRHASLTTGTYCVCPTLSFKRPLNIDKIIV